MNSKVAKKIRKETRAHTERYFKKIWSKPFFKRLAFAWRVVLGR